MGVLGLLQVAFIIMKVAGVITWSWFHVFIPFYMYLGCLALYIYSKTRR